MLTVAPAHLDVSGGTSIQQGYSGRAAYLGTPTADCVNWHLDEQAANELATYLLTRFGGRSSGAIGFTRYTLGDLVRDTYSAADIDENARALALAACEDAVTFANRNLVHATPVVSVSDDGILTLQWKSGRQGVAIMFAGDGIASFVFRGDGQRYTDRGVETAVSAELPPEFQAKLAAILSL